MAEASILTRKDLAEMEEEKSGRIYMGSQPGTVGIQKWGGDVSYHFVIRSSAAEISNETTHGGNHDKPQKTTRHATAVTEVFPTVENWPGGRSLRGRKGNTLLRNTTTERSRKKGSKIAKARPRIERGTRNCNQKRVALQMRALPLRHRAYTAKPTESLTVEYLRTLSP